MDEQRAPYSDPAPMRDDPRPSLREATPCPLWCPREPQEL